MVYVPKDIKYEYLSISPPESHFLKKKKKKLKFPQIYEKKKNGHQFVLEG